jgi:hypothetical protein
MFEVLTFGDEIPLLMVLKMAVWLHVDGSKASITIVGGRNIQLYQLNGRSPGS